MPKIIDIADRIRARRILLGLTASELAQRANINRQDVHRWEKGKNIPTIDKIEILATALECDAAWLSGFTS
jgi:transcriptional regulator with XRE-family HTH domain